MIKYVCPQCGSEEVTTGHLQMFFANTGEHYCHSVKTHDNNSPAYCTQCEWRGKREALNVSGESQEPVTGE